MLGVALGVPVGYGGKMMLPDGYGVDKLLDSTTEE